MFLCDAVGMFLLFSWGLFLGAMIGVMLVYEFEKRRP